MKYEIEIFDAMSNAPSGTVKIGIVEINVKNDGLSYFTVGEDYFENWHDYMKHWNIDLDGDLTSLEEIIDFAKNVYEEDLSQKRWEIKNETSDRDDVNLSYRIAVGNF